MAIITSGMPAVWSRSSAPGHGRAGPSPGPDRIKKVVRVGEHVRFLPDDLINRELVEIPRRIQDIVRGIYS